MKKNLLLTGVVLALLAITYLLTESAWLEARDPLAERLGAALRSARSFSLPQARLNLVEGQWYTGAGDLARADLLEEWHRSLERLRVREVIAAPEERASFFTDNLEFAIDDTVFEWGGLAPSQESFYLGIKGEAPVYLVDLQQLSSLAMADDDKVLQVAKYQRLRDLLIYPELGWREHRLLALAQLPSLLRFQKGEIVLESEVLELSALGEAGKDALSAGLMSLTVAGATHHEKPIKLKELFRWRLEEKIGKSREWIFYDYPQGGSLLLWDEGLARGWTLAAESGSYVQRFPERLVDKTLSLTLLEDTTKLRYRRNGTELEGLPRQHAVIAKFLSSAQRFELLTAVSKLECLQLARSANFETQTDAQTLAWRKSKEAWLILDCEAGLGLSWSLPLDSALDFAKLE